VCEVVGISEQSRTFVVFQIPTPSSHGNQQRSAHLCCGVHPKPTPTLCPDTFLKYQVRSQVVQLCMSGSGCGSGCGQFDVQFKGVKSLSHKL